MGDNVHIRNLGDVSWKKKVKIIEDDVEPDLIYPLLRGSDVKRWYAKPSVLIVLPNEKGGKISVSRMKTIYPKTYNFLYKLFDPLISRKGEPYTSSLRPWNELSFQEAQKTAMPFYYIFNAQKSWTKHKVVWKHVSGKISGKAVFIAAVVSTSNVKGLGSRFVIPDHGLMVVPCKSENESLYIAAILNSSVIREIVKGYSLETHITTDVLKYIHIPQFNPHNEIHEKLSIKSQEAHEAAQIDDDIKQEKVEIEIDKLVKRLYESLHLITEK
jgi:hypothetical protein